MCCERKDLSDGYEAGRNCHTTHDTISPRKALKISTLADVRPARNRWTAQYQLLYSEYHSVLGMQLTSFALVTSLALAK
jgi:hypothetical protein